MVPEESRFDSIPMKSLVSKPGFIGESEPDHSWLTRIRIYRKNFDSDDKEEDRFWRRRERLMRRSRYMVPFGVPVINPSTSMTSYQFFRGHPWGTGRANNRVAFNRTLPPKRTLMFNHNSWSFCGNQKCPSHRAYMVCNWCNFPSFSPCAFTDDDS